MRIIEVLTQPVRTGFFADDQAAIRAGAEHDGFAYSGIPITPGFLRIRQAGEAVSVMLLLEDGSVAHGDCAAVQYSGAGGRDPSSSAEAARRDVEECMSRRCWSAPSSTTFRELAGGWTPAAGAVRPAAHRDPVRRDPGGARRGRAGPRLTMAEVVRDEYATGVDLEPVPMFAQTGDDRYDNAEKMILKRGRRAAARPDQQRRDQAGRRGRALEEYLSWWRPHRRPAPRRRVRARSALRHLRDRGPAFGGDVDAVAGYLARLGRDRRARYELRRRAPDRRRRAGSADRDLRCASGPPCRRTGTRVQDRRRRVVQHP